MLINSEQVDEDLTSSPIEATAVLADVAVNEGHIQTLLNRKYIGNCKYKVPNVYVFKADWESDFFVQKENGYCYEFEIKITRSDFFADFKKKTKHDILQTGTHTVYSGIREHKYRPNKLFYVVPINLIKVEEVPKYAGLMYVEDYTVITVKEAPFIHKEKLKFEDKLCHKFYHYWLEQKRQNLDIKSAMKYMEEEIERLKSGSNIS